MSIGTNKIANERQRHIKEKGYDATHDDNMNKGGDLAKAAMCYAAFAIAPPTHRLLYRQDASLNNDGLWPLKEPMKFSSGDSLRERSRELVKAGGLIAAEIDRIERAIDRGS